MGKAMTTAGLLVVFYGSYKIYKYQNMQDPKLNMPAIDEYKKMMAMHAKLVAKLQADRNRIPKHALPEIAIQTLINATEQERTLDLLCNVAGNVLKICRTDAKALEHYKVSIVKSCTKMLAVFGETVSPKSINDGILEQINFVNTRLALIEKNIQEEEKKFLDAAYQKLSKFTALFPAFISNTHKIHAASLKSSMAEEKMQHEDYQKNEPEVLVSKEYQTGTHENDKPKRFSPG